MKKIAKLYDLLNEKKRKIASVFKTRERVKILKGEGLCFIMRISPLAYLI